MNKLEEILDRHGAFVEFGNFDKEEYDKTVKEIQELFLEIVGEDEKIVYPPKEVTGQNWEDDMKDIGQKIIRNKFKQSLRDKIKEVTGKD